MAFMSLVPFRDRNVTRPETNVFGSLQREIDRLFEDFTRNLGMYGTQGLNLVPHTDVTENEKEIEITVEMPGLERKNVEISVEDTC
jgi:HSP20 family protein